MSTPPVKSAAYIFRVNGEVWVVKSDELGQAPITYQDVLNLTNRLSGAILPGDTLNDAEAKVLSTLFQMPNFLRIK